MNGRPFFTEIDSNTFLVDKGKIEDIELGMRRRNITSLLIDSIQGKISTWADIDRSAQGRTASLKYYAQDEDERSMSDSSDGSNLDGQKAVQHNNGEVVGEHDGRLYSFSSKTQNHLFLLVEHICHARMVSFIYQYQSDLQNAACVVIDYCLCGH
jgi:hypothetical protein